MVTVPFQCLWATGSLTASQAHNHTADDRVHRDIWWGPLAALQSAEAACPHFRLCWVYWFFKLSYRKLWPRPNPWLLKALSCPPAYSPSLSHGEEGWACLSLHAVKSPDPRTVNVPWVPWVDLVWNWAGKEGRSLTESRDFEGKWSNE